MSYIYINPYELEIGNGGINIDKTGRATFSNATLSEGAKNMETLYNVILVNDVRDIILDEKVVARDEETAKFRTNVYALLTENALDLDDVTIIVNALGRVRVCEELIN